jgi:hypothetical protein
MSEPLMDEKTRSEIRDALSRMAEPVRLLLFVDRDDPCEACQTQERLLEAVAAPFGLWVFGRTRGGPRAGTGPVVRSA